MSKAEFLIVIICFMSLYVIIVKIWMDHTFK